jgi:hypothetical protein
MRNAAAHLSFFVGMCVAGSVQAAELSPIAGLSIKLGDVLGTAYYTVEKDGYQVVATVASGENATPVRFVTTLLSGQKTSLSVPGAVGVSAQTMEIKRIGDRVFVNEGEQLSTVIP